jgi:predicted GNAT family N-acyltransferase
MQVFVEEQGISAEIEVDEEGDRKCLHAIAMDTKLQKPVGTGRLFPDGHVGRMAVLKEYRGCGIGKKVLLALEAQCSAKETILNAQTSAAKFYLNNGYVQQGEVFEEAGIEHIEMRKKLAH